MACGPALGPCLVWTEFISRALAHRRRERRRVGELVRVADRLPTTKQVCGTNFCDLTARLVRGRAVVISVEDNLIKGAAGAAVQNFNLMYSFDETTALEA